MHEMTRQTARGGRVEEGLWRGRGWWGYHLGHLQSSCIPKLKMGEIAQTQSGRLISFSGEVGGKKKVEGNETRAGGNLRGQGFI